MQKDDVASVADLYAKEYKAFAEKFATKDCSGIKPMEKQDDGTYKAGKQAIEGTKFKSLKEMGFSPVSLEDGSFALVCTDNSAKAVDTRKGPEGLNAFNRAFNSHMSQVVSQTFESGSVARNLAAQTSYSKRTPWWAPVPAKAFLILYARGHADTGSADLRAAVAGLGRVLRHRGGGHLGLEKPQMTRTAAWQRRIPVSNSRKLAGGIRIRSIVRISGPLLLAWGASFAIVAAGTLDLISLRTRSRSSLPPLSGK